MCAGFYNALDCRNKFYEIQRQPANPKEEITQQ